MTWIKICGMTNLEDALVAAQAGADAVGFVFYAKSSRKIDVDAAREIVKQLPERVEKVGVFVGNSPEEVEDCATRAGLTMVQFYPGDEKFVPARSPAISQEHGYKLILATSSEALNGGGLGIGDEAKRRIYAMLIDSGSGDRVGGTGISFDWEKYRSQLKDLSREFPVIVAGGLNPENVHEAIQILKPWGVDVASGVEASPGKKDSEKVRAFVKAVRAADGSV
jgi:phosphoribosylanthranilate isomerase